MWIGKPNTNSRLNLWLKFKTKREEAVQKEKKRTGQPPDLLIIQQKMINKLKIRMLCTGAGVF
jgi:hypothetical protein